MGSATDEQAVRQHAERSAMRSNLIVEVSHIPDASVQADPEAEPTDDA